MAGPFLRWLCPNVLPEVLELVRVVFFFFMD